MNEIDPFFSSCQAGGALLEEALATAKRDTPQAYRDIVELVEAGLARPQLVIEFLPQMTVVLRVVAAGGGTVDLARLEARQPAGQTH